MRYPLLTKMVLIIVGLALLSGFVYWLPPVHSRLSWRVDFALTYVRGMLSPAGAVPTALPQPRVQITRHPTTTPLPPAALISDPLSGTITATATTGPTATPTYTPTPPPQAMSLTAPEWEKQDINNCGPATLTMYLRYYGWEGDQFAITEEIKPQREDRNVNVEEIAYYVRTFAGWLNIEYRVGGDLQLLKRLIAAGIPVMIEEGFKFEETYWPNDDQWAAHYNLITGYDDDKELFTAQDSFYGANLRTPYDKLDEQWQAFNRVYILVYPPEMEPVVRSILGTNWDMDVNREYAMEVAREETESDPENAYAWFNLGTNLTYFERYTEATQAFDTARNLGLPQRMLRYQFGPFLAYFHSGRTDDLLALTEYALERTPNGEEALLWQGWALYRKGKTGEALTSFQQALAENPTYADAQYAINFVRENQ